GGPMRAALLWVMRQRSPGAPGEKRPVRHRHRAQCRLHQSGPESTDRSRPIHHCQGWELGVQAPEGRIQEGKLGADELNRRVKYIEDGGLEKIKSNAMLGTADDPRFFSAQLCPLLCPVRFWPTTGPPRPGARRRAPGRA